MGERLEEADSVLGIGDEECTVPCGYSGRAQGCR